MSDFNLKYLANNLSLSQGKEYIKQYFVPLTNGNHAILTSHGTYNIISRDIIKQVYLIKQTECPKGIIALLRKRILYSSNVTAEQSAIVVRLSSALNVLVWYMLML